MNPKEKKEKIVTTTCCSHCGGQCVLRVHVSDGRITRLETDAGEEPQLRACVRGRAYRQRVYDPERIKTPLKRVGARGEGRFTPISWDEALDSVADQIKRVRAEYGSQSILFLGGGGDTMELHRQTLIQDLLMRTGGCTKTWGVSSFEGALFASVATYGTLSSVGDTDDWMNSRLLVLWGFDPASTVQRTNTTWYLQQAKERGARIVAIDPRLTPTTATLADKWLPIIPGTDAAMLLAMAHVIIQENLQDQPFLDRYTHGYAAFREHILGADDGIPKTPAWASAITGVPSADIVELAREYATTKPAALVAGTGPGRTAFGEQYHRAAHALQAMTGNIGIHGGWAGAVCHPIPMFGGFNFQMGRVPSVNVNPVETGSPRRPDALPTIIGSDLASRIHFAEVADAIFQGRAGGFPADIKMVLVASNNPINQFPNSPRLARAFEQLEFVAVVEQVMTATARWADIILPTGTYMERNDIALGGAVPHFSIINQAIEPLYESTSMLQICNGLAARFGIIHYASHDELEWRRELAKDSLIPDFDAFVEKGIYRVPLPEPRVAFQQEINDPANHPFPTPSGKIEIYSQPLAAMNQPLLPPIPKYIEAWEGRADPLAARYPLQLLTTHFKLRAHSQYENIPWLRELTPQAVTLNPKDAAARGIKEGDTVYVFNERGTMMLPALVSERIMPGVVDIPQGAWFSPDAAGIDRRGCANTLTRDVGSPGGAACHNTALVEVSKAPPDA